VAREQIQEIKVLNILKKVETEEARSKGEVKNPY